MQTLPSPVQATPTETAIVRRKTRPVPVGSVIIGGGHPVAVQSMINEDTLDIEGSVAAIRRLHEIGCEIVRVTVPSLAHAKAMEEIRDRLYQTYKPVPLVADVHHNGMKIALEVAKYVDNVRINPGLYVFEKPKPDRTEYTQAEFEEIGAKIRETLEPLVISLRDQGKSMRIGVNHGSLAERMLFTYGDTPEGMVESALEFIRICESLNFYNLEISLKASRVPVMIAANRLMVKRMDELGMDYPSTWESLKPAMASMAASNPLLALPPSLPKVLAIRFVSPSPKPPKKKFPSATAFCKPWVCGAPWWSMWPVPPVAVPSLTLRKSCTKSAKPPNTSRV